MNNNQNERYFPVEGQLRYHWCANQDNMAIINRKDKSPETSELVTRQIKLAKPGAIRPYWNKNLGSEIYLPRQPEEREKREIKRIDLQFKKKKESPRSAFGILEISETKYHKEQHKI